MQNFKDNITDLLESGVRDGVYPGAVLLVAKRGETILIKETGNRSIIPVILPMEQDAIFDLASLTKPLATTLAIMKFVDDGRIALDQPLSGIIKSAPLGDKKDLTIRSILSHCAGFRDCAPFYQDLIKVSPDGRKAALREMVIKEPLRYAPGSDSLYSDLGYMILEWVVEETSGEDLRAFVHGNFYVPMGLKRTFLGSPASPLARDQFAATEDCPWRKRVLQGEVHDENAWAAGGYSGHAGLFGTAADVSVIVEMLRGHYLGIRNDIFSRATVRAFFKRQEIIKGSTRALGWDTPSSEGSSAGRFISSNSVGHLGFTGTSLWMDLDRDLFIIFLSNRVHPTRNNIKIKAFRPMLHDMIFKEIDDIR